MLFEITNPPDAHFSVDDGDNNSTSCTSRSAVVILYGWLGAQPQHLQKYADMYANMNMNTNTNTYTNNLLSCTVIHGTAPNSTILTRQSKELSAAATESVQKAATVIRKLEEKMNNTDKIPVIIHYFSNGGAYIAEHLERNIRMILTDENKATASDDEIILNNDIIEDDYRLVADRLQQARGSCEIADSAPAYMHMSSGLRAIEANKAPLPIQFVLKAMFLVNIFYGTVISFVTNQDLESVKFWENMEQSSMLCNRQAFIYSTKDVLTDPEKLEEFIDARRKRSNLEVSVLKFDDTEHVLHYRKHPKKYIDFLVQILNNDMDNEKPKNTELDVS